MDNILSSALCFRSTLAFFYNMPVAYLFTENKCACSTYDKLYFPFNVWLKHFSSKSGQVEHLCCLKLAELLLQCLQVTP